MVLSQLCTWLNGVMNAVASVVLAPIAVLPGWLSATIAAAATGTLFLLVFKHTSNQPAIQRVRDDISANTLALKLFKDSTRVALRAQGRLLAGALRLLGLAIVPMLVLAIPALLILGQLSLWYQARPLRVGEEALVALKLRDEPTATAFPSVTLQSPSGVEVTAGPVRVVSRREVYWNLKATAPGVYTLAFQADQEAGRKSLTVGEGFLRLSRLRPRWNWLDILLNPGERPFPAGSAFQSIEIAYPARDSWTSGTDFWVAYWFIVSVIAAFALRGPLNVRL